MWDRFRQKGEGAPSLNRKKLEAWQNAHSSSSAYPSRGVKGGNGQYQYSVRGGPAPKRPPLRDVGHSTENSFSSSQLQLPIQVYDIPLSL
ncbi:hypothetical protein GGR50DRAFT_336216 [Xylaria sp. CBS 124048]|nr:hypothetical protein GGR50DRAFT_336216 [Xylaria sp. CBS 124048]